MVFYGLWSTKPKNFTPKELGTRRQKIRWCGLQSHAPIRTASANVPHVSHVPHVPHVPLVPHAPSALWRHGWRHPLLTRLSRFDPDRLENLIWFELPQKKKKKRKRKCFDQVEFWPWLESQNFQNGPVPLNFSSTFRFWDPFLHSKLRNCANIQFPKKLTFVQMLTKCQNF